MCSINGLTCDSTCRRGFRIDCAIGHTAREGGGHDNLFHDLLSLQMARGHCVVR
jgi:hypothetical protein